MSDDFTMAQAKRDFHIGHMESFHFERPLWANSGWIVQLKAGAMRGPLVASRGVDARVFKTLDAAVSAVEQIGFKVDYLRG